MEIIKGTPEEIALYLSDEAKKEEIKKATSDSIFAISGMDAFPLSKPRHTYGKDFVRARLKTGKHWSNSKAQWVKISEMDSSYILNALRKELRENKNDDLLTDDEFHSFMLTLTDRYADGE